MKLVRKYPLLGSSVNPGKLSLMIKGVLVAVVPVLTLLFASLGYAVTGQDLSEVANTIVVLIEQGGVIISTLMILVGGIRKIVIAIKDR